jgi:hypothetical protein
LLGDGILRSALRPKRCPDVLPRDLPNAAGVGKMHVCSAVRLMG